MDKTRIHQQNGYYKICAHPTLKTFEMLRKSNDTKNQN